MAFACLIACELKHGSMNYDNVSPFEKVYCRIILLLLTRLAKTGDESPVS